MNLILSAAGIKIEFEKIKQFLKKILLGYLGFFICVILTDLMYNRSEVKAFFRSTTVYSIPNVISVLALTQYFLLLDILQDCYAKIRNILLMLPDEYNCSNYFQKFERKNEQIRRFDVKLETMRVLCLDLTKLNKDINSSFGLLTISTIISTFLILSIQFYAFYTIFERLQETEDIWLVIYTTLWILLHGAKTFSILLFNHFVNEEVSRKYTDS